MLTGTCHCGALSWRLTTPPQRATACNCTICRRYGVLWAYGFIGHDIDITGPSQAYRRADSGDIDFHFCPTCGCVTHYVGRDANAQGRHQTAVNLRLSDPDAIATLPVRHFDGHDSFAGLPEDGRTVRDMWF